MMSLMKRARNLLDAIGQSSELKVRASLIAWMRENRDAFAGLLSGRVADWSVLARMFAEAGLTDRYGNPPKPETARKSWQRVRKEVAATPVRRPPPSPPPLQPKAVPKPAEAIAGGNDLLRVLREMGGSAGKMPDPIK